MDQRHLILDVDGVLLDFVAGFADFVVDLGHELAISPSESRDYDLGDLLPGLPLEERRSLFNAFTASPDFATLTPLSGACEAIDCIKAIEPQLRIVALTAIGLSPEVQAMRRANLRIFNLDGIEFAPFGGCKAQQLAQFAPGSVFIDDLQKNVDAGLAAGHEAFLFRQPHNAAFVHERVLADWEDALERALLLLRSRAEVDFPRLVL